MVEDDNPESGADLSSMDLREDILAEPRKDGGGRRAGGDGAVVIEPLQWLLEDRRPQGYVQTTDLRLRAKALGIRYQDVVPRYLRHPWRALLKKAKTRGLTEEECRRVSEYSIIIAHKLRKAIEAHGSAKEPPQAD